MNLISSCLYLPSYFIYYWAYESWRAQLVSWLYRLECLNCFLSLGLCLTNLSAFSYMFSKKLYLLKSICISPGMECPGNRHLFFNSSRMWNIFSPVCVTYHFLFYSGVEFGARMITIDGKQIKLQIWDTVSIPKVQCMISVKFQRSTLYVCCVLVLFYVCYGLLDTNFPAAVRWNVVPADSLILCSIFSRCTPGSIRCLANISEQCADCVIQREML